MNITKQHKIISFAIGILFLVVLQTFSAPHPIYRFLAPAFILYLAALTAYNRRYLKALGKYNVWVLVRPLMLWAGAFGIFWFLPNDFLRGVFLIPCAAVGSFVEYFLGNFSENVLLNETLLIAFGCFVAFSAAGLYYGFRNWLVPGLVLCVYVLARSFYEFVPEQKNMRIVSSLALALFCGEIFWALSFLPLHYSAAALLLFNVFYFCLILNYYYIYQTLNRQKIKFHFILMAGITALILLATPWRILK